MTNRWLNLTNLKKSLDGRQSQNGPDYQYEKHSFDLTKTQDTVDAAVIKWADSIAGLQKQVEINSFRHVVQTRKICTPDQQAAYDSLMKRIINKGRSRRPGDGPPPREDRKTPFATFARFYPLIYRIFQMKQA
ncbi:hypothetical protein LWM68_40485 [Niabella sp. W65]|nr:hypothetical protein [Niabella sp. W65]MCH7368461.1 hypothetical protein [Niabella sp. W65]ULT44056.1 hypothetical protein KRR40_12195 [Niabella sp. I65]